MVFHRHVPIIPYHIDTIFFNSPWGKIPVTRITDVGFLDLLAINKELLHEIQLVRPPVRPPALKKHGFALKTNHYDIMPLGSEKR
jgi:hypothetical protein